MKLVPVIIVRGDDTSYSPEARQSMVGQRVPVMVRVDRKAGVVRGAITRPLYMDGDGNILGDVELTPGLPE